MRAQHITPTSWLHNLAIVLSGVPRAEVGAKNSKGLTPLHVSCLKPNASMVSLLLLWGADTNARDRKKRTPEQIIGTGKTLSINGNGLV